MMKKNIEKCKKIVIHKKYTHCVNKVCIPWKKLNNIGNKNAHSQGGDSRKTSKSLKKYI
jgi:hypothetical protein